VPSCFTALFNHFYVLYFFLSLMWLQLRLMLLRPRRGKVVAALWAVRRLLITAFIQRIYEKL